MIIRHEKVKAGIIGWGENTLLLADLLTRYSKNIDLVALSTSRYYRALSESDSYGYITAQI